MLRKMVRTLFTNASTHLLLKGKECSSFTVHRSIRQGCLLAPLLYVVIIEPLMAVYLRETTLGLIRILPGPDGT